MLVVLPTRVRRLLALELLFGRRAISLSSFSLRLLGDLVAWLYKPLHFRRHQVRILPFGLLQRPLRVYHVLGLGAVSIWGAFKLQEWSKRPRAKMRALRVAMEAATSYESFHEAAEALEALDESRARMKRTFNERYDSDLIRGRVEYLKKIQERGDAYELMFVLRSDLLRNAGNMADAMVSIQVCLVLHLSLLHVSNHPATRSFARHAPLVRLFSRRPACPHPSANT